MSGANFDFTPDEYAAVLDRMNRRAAWHDQRWRIVHAIRFFGQGKAAATGIIPLRFGRSVRDIPTTFRSAVPWGWRVERDWDRDAFRLMPLWLYAIRRLGYWKWRWMVPLIRVGLMQGEEGGYFKDFRPSWRIWESRDAQMLYPRFAQFVKSLHDDWTERMPRWP